MNKPLAPGVEERLMRWLIPLLCAGLFFGVTPGHSLAAARKSRTVLVLGDSLSAGYGLAKARAYPQLLAAKAAAAGYRLEVINAGVSGDTSAGGLRRLPRLLRQHVDVLVLELGINDFFRGTPVPEIEANLQKIIDRTRRRYPQVRIVIAGMQLPNYSEGDYVTRFGAMYAELAQRNQAAFVPFLLKGVLGDPTLNLSDMIHPNAAGQKILAENVWPVLATTLKKS